LNPLGPSSEPKIIKDVAKGKCSFLKTSGTSNPKNRMMPSMNSELSTRAIT
jgi:hypothetical protein